MVVYDGEEAVAATACFLMSYPLETMLGAPLKKIAAQIRKFFPGAFCLKALICGLPMDQGQIGVRPCRAKEAVDQILRSMDKIARENKAGFLAFKDFGLAYTDILDPIQKLGFYKFASFPSTEIKISFECFEDYVKILSRASRDSLKRKLKK